MLIVFDDMIADIMTNKKFRAVTKELFIRCRKLKIYLVFITQFYFSVPKEIKRELQQIAINHSADIDYRDFLRSTEIVQMNLILFDY